MTILHALFTTYDELNEKFQTLSHDLSSEDCECFETVAT